MVIQPRSKTTLDMDWKILIIDDDEDDFLIARGMLHEAQGRRIDAEWASGYEAGRQALASQHYHAILVDYDLGGHTGIELIREASERGTSSPLILFSGRTTYDTDVEAMEAGATMFLSKGEANALLLERAIRYAIERKQFEVALQQSEEKFATAFKNNPAAMTIARLSDGRFTEANRSFCRMVGYRREEIVGHSSVELGLTSQQMLEEILDQYGQEGSIQDKEVLIIDRYGAVKTVLVSLDPIVVNAEACMIATMIDITERKRAEEIARRTLAQAEAGRQTLEALMQYIPEGITIADSPDATIRMVSQYGQQLLGGAHTDKTAGQVDAEWKVFEPDGVTPLPPERLPLMRAIRQGEVVKGQDIVQINSRGEKLYLSCNAGPIRDEQGQITGAVVAWREVTEQKRLEEKNREQKDLLERLMESAPAGIAFAQGPRHVYTLANQEFHRIAQGKGELIGRTVAEVWPEIAHIIIPQHDQVYRTGESFSGVDAPFTIIRDGVPTENFYTYTHAPVYKADGSIDGVMTLAVDTTQAVLNQQVAETQSARLETVLQALPVGVWITDREGRVLQKNVQADRIWAGDAPLVEGPHQYHTYRSWDAHTGIELETKDFALTRALKTGQPVGPVEQRIQRFDGSEGYVLVSAVPIKDSSGQIIGAVAINLDITGRKQAEQSVKAREARMRAVFQSLVEGVVFLNKDGVVVEINDAVQSTYDHTLEELSDPRSDPRAQIIRPDGSPFPPEEQPAVQALRTGQAQRNVELGVPLKDGRISWRLVNAQPVYDEQGELMGAVASFFDITQRKQADQALRESQARLIELVESTQNNYVALDREWRFTYANRHFGELMEVDSQTLIGKHYWQVFPHYAGTDLERNYRKVMAERVPMHYQQEGIYTKRMFDVSIFPTQEGIAIFSVDRTEELRYQQQLENERARLEAVLQALPVAVWIAEPDGLLVFKNEQADRIWGGDAPLSEDIHQYREYVAWFMESGKPVAPEDFPVAQALITGQPGKPVELRIRRFDGSEGVVLAIGAPIKDRAGRLTGAVAVNLDMSVYRQAEMARRESESKYQAVFHSSPFAIILARLSDGRIIDVNPAWEELFEIKREVAIGKTAVELGTAIDPEARQRGYEEMRKTGRLRNFEVRYRTPTGKEFIASNNAETIAVNGEPCLLSSTEDITERKEAERKLRVSEELFRNVLESTHDIVFLLHSDWRFRYVNQKFAETYKEFAQDFIGRQFFEVFPRYQGGVLDQHYRKVMEERVPVHFEVESAYSDSTFEISAYPILDGIAVFARDRSEERRAQRALNESRERLERAQQIAHLGSWELDTANNRLEWSDEAYRIFGLQPRELSANYETFLECVHPDDRAAVDEAYTGSLRENKDGYEIEHRVVRARTGEIRYVHEKCEHFRDSSGKIVRSVGMVHDITERKLAEQALRENSEALKHSEEKFARAFKASPLASAISTVAEGRFIEVNEHYTDLFGFSREEALNHTSIELGMFPDPEDRKEVVSKFREKNGFRNFEVRLLKKSGEPVDVLFSAERMEIDGQDCMLSMVIDITERKQAEAALQDYAERLKRSNQELEQFAFIASHDLQEPLRKVIMFGNSLRSHLGDCLDSSTSDSLDRMRNAAARMQKMINGLLDLSRVSSRGGEFTPIHTTQVVEEAVSDLEARIRMARGRVEVGELPDIQADELQIRQLFQNLIANSIKFHKPDTPPVVQISGALLPGTEPPVVEIQVRDNGIGFEQQYARQIFQPFQRLHQRNEYEGTGLGLAICQKIVDRHHGTITVQSAPDQGATFTVRLPQRPRK